MNKKYINISDFQGGSWYIGVVGTIKEWKEIALSWCETDDNEELFDYIKDFEENKDLLDFISEVWSIEIVKFNKKNKEHLKLKKDRESWCF